MTRRAFTLVELVVVIGIIVLLVGITVTVGVNVVEKAEVRKTENLIQLLDMALQEWELAADRKLSWGDGDIYDIQQDWPHVLILPAVLDTMSRNSTVKGIMSKIDPDHMYRFDTNNPDVPEPRWISSPASDDPDPNATNAQSIYAEGAFDNGRLLTGMVTVLDAWDEPLRVIHPGRVADPNLGDSTDPEDTDTDGTIFVDDSSEYESGYEKFYGAAVSRQFCFVSAGPDGKFGDVSQPINTQAFKQSMDNIYSYEVIRP